MSDCKKNNVIPDLLVKRLNSLRIVKDEKVSFSAFGLQEIVPILATKLSFNNTIPEESKAPIVRETIFAAAKNTITVESLLENFKNSEKKYLSQKPQRFYLLTTISFNNSITIPKFIINKSHIIFKSQFKDIEQEERSQFISLLEEWLFREFPKSHLAVRVSTSGKNHFEAVNKALDNLDLLRAIFNFALRVNYSISLAITGLNKPINKIILGPLHTLHNLNGSSFDKRYWYDAYYNEKATVFNAGDKIPNLLKFTESFRKKLNKLPYKEILTAALLRYVRALDFSDYEIAFVKLWGVLELLTGTSRESNELTVKRASFLLSESEYHRYALDHLRIVRNENIHRGKNIQEQEACTYQLKRYVQELLIYHILNVNQFDKFEHSIEFLDYPAEIEKLKFKRNNLDKAITFRAQIESV